MESIQPSNESALRWYHDFLHAQAVENWPRWRGRMVQKNPLDLWTYTEIIGDTCPSVIVECGTSTGGSAMFFSDIQRQNTPSGRVITIDELEVESTLNAFDLFNQHRSMKTETVPVTFLHGTTQFRGIHDRVVELIRPTDAVMVVLDAGHKTAQVLEELRLYSPLVSPGCYLVAEGTNVDYCERKQFGPSRAVDRFLEDGGAELFERDLTREKFGVTFNPGGWLKRR